ncbi:MAG: hypothetical protein N2746_12405 [Deltaproteobacteria bacterium]|nr:hypothetical protein [Deltaproteobacteria bacterium]
MKIISVVAFFLTVLFSTSDMYANDDINQPKSDVTKYSSICKLIKKNNDYSIHFIFYENSEIVKQVFVDVDLYYVENDSPLSVECFNQFSFLITKRGVGLYLPGFDRISMSDNYSVVYGSVYSILLFFDDYENLRDVITKYSLDYREKDNSLEGVYVLTKEGKIIYASPNSNFRKKTLSQGYIAVGSYKVNTYYFMDNQNYKKVSLHVFDGWAFIFSPEKMLVLRHDNGIKSYYTPYYYDRQKVTLKKEDNVVKVIGDREGLIIRFELYDDYIVVHRWGETDIYKVDKTDKNEE